jgi:hypothetical protein
MEFKFSADLPRVRRSPMAPYGQIILMHGYLFEDDRSRLVVHDRVSDAFFAECEKAIIQMDKADADHAEVMRKVQVIQELMGETPSAWDSAHRRHG